MTEIKAPISRRYTRGRIKDGRREVYDSDAGLWILYTDLALSHKDLSILSDIYFFSPGGGAFGGGGASGSFHSDSASDAAVSSDSGGSGGDGGGD